MPHLAQQPAPGTGEGQRASPAALLRQRRLQHRLVHLFEQVSTPSVEAHLMAPPFARTVSVECTAQFQRRACHVVMATGPVAAFGAFAGWRGAAAAVPSRMVVDSVTWPTLQRVCAQNVSRRLDRQQRWLGSRAVSMSWLSALQGWAGSGAEVRHSAATNLARPSCCG